MTGSEFIEKIRERDPRALGIMALVAGALAVGGFFAVDQSSKNESCLSPAALSDIYPGDRGLQINANDQSTWRLAALAVSRTLPTDSTFEGLVFGFRDPNSTNSEFKLSNPVPPSLDRLDELLIGPGNIQFEARIQANAGSPDCNTPPNTEFVGPQLRSKVTQVVPIGRPEWP